MLSVEFPRLCRKQPVNDGFKKRRGEIPMRIEWGFLSSLTVLVVTMFTASELRSQTAPAEPADVTSSSANQTPLPSQASFGWSQGPQDGPPSSFGGYPAAQAAWPPAPGLQGGFPGGLPGGFPGGPMMQASFEGGTEMPQPFPGPVPMPLEESHEQYLEAPYPAPFEGLIGDANCPYCGGSGCESCGAGGGGLLGWLVNGMRPYQEGGICAPRWYDITLDAMFLTRDQPSRNINFASDGINGNPVLSTDQLDFQEQLGFRFTGATQVGVGLIAEFTYFGLFNWADQQAVTRPVGDLFSVYSNFGTNPFNGFDQTDRSFSQEITYSTSLDNFELNFRRRWSDPNCRYQGSWLAGVRYIYMVEEFEYNTAGGDDILTPAIEIQGRQETDVHTRNSLTGFQIGADIWTTPTPGITFGGELKGGVFGNYANQQTVVVARTGPPIGQVSFFEEAGINDIAFAGEGRLEAIYRTGPNWTLRAGYTFLYLDGLALAAENFNTAAPPNLAGIGFVPRQAAKNDNGGAFYHGGHFGFEYVW